MAHLRALLLLLSTSRHLLVPRATHNLVSIKQLVNPLKRISQYNNEDGLHLLLISGLEIKFSLVSTTNYSWGLLSSAHSSHHIWEQ